MVQSKTKIFPNLDLELLKISLKQNDIKRKQKKIKRLYEIKWLYYQLWFEPDSQSRMIQIFEEKNPSGTSITIVKLFRLRDFCLCEYIWFKSNVWLHGALSSHGILLFKNQVLKKFTRVNHILLGLVYMIYMDSFFVFSHSLISPVSLCLFFAINLGRRLCLSYKNQHDKNWVLETKSENGKRWIKRWNQIAGLRHKNRDNRKYIIILNFRFSWPKGTLETGL